MAKREPLPIIVFISGNGSNLQAIIDAIDSLSLPAKITAVISSKANAYGLERGQRANLHTGVLCAQDFANRHEYDQALCKYIEQFPCAYIVLAGFMHVLGSCFLQKYPNRIINIHPSLLPLYPGLNTHAGAIKNGDLEHGCTVHFVNENVDAGPIIAQTSVKIRAEDTTSTLQQRVHKAEYFLYPTVLNWLANERIQLREDHVLMDNIPMPQRGLRFVLNVI